ncbi:hypothetical protein V7S43_002709 [Phytophthora oleae]|uniref:Kazal-like domain-containing protein n=1 Tax=Phytophthora oleae TaxID=2107226 RepID=A0ABD3FYQ3_9STRA
MKFAIVSVLASLLIAVTPAQGFECANVGTISCDGGGDTTRVCASNGVTYMNKCEFHKANCDNKGMTVLYNGICRRGGGR